MNFGVLRLSLVLSALALLFVGLSTAPRTAQALPGDTCQMIAWDSTGHVLGNGDTVGGNGQIYVLGRMEDDAFGYVSDFLDGPVEELIQPLRDEIQSLKDQIVDAGYDEDITVQEVDDLIDAEDPGTPAYEDLVDLRALVVERDALQEILDEYEAAIDFSNYDIAQVDAQTGAARITSQAEVTGFEWVKPSVWAHLDPA